MADPRRPKGGFAIAVTCPGCGGELTLQEDYFSLTCGHCGSVLRIIMPDTPPVFIINNRKADHEIRFAIDRFFKENELPLARSGYRIQRLYVPYWKIEAIRVKVNRAVPPMIDDDPRGGVDDESGLLGLASASAAGYSSVASSGSTRQVTVAPFTVTQSAAGEREGIPFSIGLRAEYVTMKPFSSDEWDEQARFLPATVSWADVQAGLSRSAAKRELLESGGSEGVERWQLFHPAGSLIYFPYLAATVESGAVRRRLLLDGLTGRVVHSVDGPDANRPFPVAETAIPAGGRLTVAFHRCPDCGVDLPVTRSVVYRCHNCGVVISLETNRIFAGTVDLAGGTENPGDHLLPFWVLTVAPEAVRAMAAYPTGGLAGDRIVVPAFAMGNFEAMRRLCRRMTAVFPSLAVGPAANEGRRPAPATVPLAEAIGLAEIVIHTARMAASTSVAPEPTDVKPEAAGLVYVPFHRDNYFMIDSALNAVTFEGNAVTEDALVETV